jgi:hypothetical protein
MQSARAHSKCFTRTIKHAALWLRATAGRALHNRIEGSQDSKVSLLLLRAAASATLCCVYAALCVYWQFAGEQHLVVCERADSLPRRE